MKDSRYLFNSMSTFRKKFVYGREFETHADRLTIEQLPAYSPDFNPIEHLWKKVKKEATHLKHFPEFSDLQQEVDRALLQFAQTPREITVLMARYCEKLGRVDKAA